MRPDPRASVARWGGLAASVMLGLLLIATAAWSYGGVRARRADLARGQASIVGRAVRTSLMTASHPPTSAELESLIEEYGELGLLWVGLVSADGSTLSQAGQRSASAHMPQQPADLVILQDTVRVMLPPPEGLRLGGPPGPPGPAGGPAGGRPGDARPAVVLELSPIFAADLLDRTGQSLFVAVLGALVLVGASVVFWRQSQRAESTERALADTRQLAALGEMSAVLAHELKNPLASLKGHAQLLAELLEGQPQAPRADTVVFEAQRIELLIEDLLAFARTGRLDPVSTDPAALVRDVAEHGVSFAVSVKLDHPPASWRLDPARLRQVLVNLLVNAHQAAPDPPVELSASTGLVGGSVQPVPGGPRPRAWRSAGPARPDL